MGESRFKPMTFSNALIIGALGVSTLWAQATVSEIRLHTDPPGARLRPFENLAIQVRVYGTAGNRSGRIRRDGAQLTVLTPNGGWLSKPFRFQGQDDEPFIDQYQSTAGRIFGSLSGRYVMQDAVLYTAPQQPGEYELQATLEGHSATLTIHVDPEAPSNRKPESVAFPAEPFSLDPYRDLAEHWSPFLAQETWFEPKSDYPTRFDYDGDWNGANNWQNRDNGTSQAYVYYAVMETATHWFLIYNVFHPRDYSDKCVAGSCHENDNEGLILTIAKDGGPYGRLQVMETLAHNNVYSFVAADGIRAGIHNIDGPVEFYQQTHPIVFIEAGGHGIYGTASDHARYDAARDTFTAGTGVTYVYKGVAERPRHPNDRLVGYELLPVYQHWWVKANRDSGWSEPTFDDYFTYTPNGARPRAACQTIGGAFLGRTNGVNMAKPFWGWHDNRTRKRDVLAVGQWGLDPAYAVSQNLRFPAAEPFSLTYVFNPYLELVTSPQPAPPSRPAEPVSAPSEPLLTSGTVQFRLWVDGSLEATISGDRIGYRVLSGAPYRDATHHFSSPLPRTTLSSLDLEVRQGRGRVQILEAPSPENGYSIRLRIDDPKPSGETYHVVLHWRS